MYRGNLGTFVDADGDGAADSYGSCLHGAVPFTTDIDSSAPPTGAGYFYLVTGRNPAGEATLGQAASGAARPNVSPCP